MADIPEDQLEEFKQAFALFDKDGNGCVDANELGQVLASLGQIPTEEEIKRMMPYDLPHPSILYPTYVRHTVLYILLSVLLSCPVHKARRQ